MKNNRTRRKLILLCALLLLGFARTAEAAAGCCPTAVAQCDDACTGHAGQYSCAEGFAYYHCTCNDVTVQLVPKTGQCGG